MELQHFLSILVLILNISLLKSESLKTEGNNTIFKLKGPYIGFPEHHNLIKATHLKKSKKPKKKPIREDGCWLTSDIRKLFLELNRIEDTYLEDINKFKQQVQKSNVDKRIIASFETPSENQVLTHAIGEIPAGLMVEGQCIVEIDKKFNILYGLKLRNNTKFIIKHFKSDWNDMTVSISLSLNDLYLNGDYDRSFIDRSTGFMPLSSPLMGKTQVLIEGADYNMEGRYRLTGGKLSIEHSLSKLMTKEVQVLLDNGTQWNKLELDKTDDLIFKLQNELESWLKEYFNFYLATIDLEYIAKYHEYEKVKELFLNQYMDYIIKKNNKRLSILKLDTVNVPDYELFTPSSTELRLVQGFVEGLDTMYRRSIATVKGNDKVLVTNADVAFSNLKVYYKYETLEYLEGKTEKSEGTLILQADDLTAHFRLKHIKKLARAEIRISSLKQAKNAVLVEGSPEKFSANFKQLLKQNIYAVMSKVLTKAVSSINLMPKCNPVETGKQFNQPKVIAASNTTTTKIH